MSNRRKLVRGWKLFDTYQDRKYKVQIQTYIGTDLNNHGHFRADYGTESYQGKTYDELIEKLRKAVERSSNIAWHPIMKVRVKSERWSDRHNVGGVQLEAERFYIGQRGDGTWARVSWDTDEQDKATRTARSENFEIWYVPRGKYSSERMTFQGIQSLPLHIKNRDGDETPDHCLYYSEALWQGIMSVQAELKKLQGKLDALLGTPEGLIRIEEFAGKLLPEVASEK